MSNQQTCNQHRPLLMNPLLDFLFNNSAVSDSSNYKSIVKKLASSPDDYVLLVPDTRFLLLHSDHDSNTPYKELCHNLDFIQSHIINICLKPNPEFKRSKTFVTLNGKELVVRNDMIISAKGFKHDFRVKILRKEFFKTFVPYIPFGTNFQIFYIEESLIGLPQDHGIRKYEPTMAEDPSIVALNSTGDNNIAEAKITMLETKSYDDLAFKFPMLSLALGSKFKNLFQSFTVKKIENGTDLNEAFVNAMAQGSQIFNSLSDELHCNSVKQSSMVDLRQTIYTYIETNIYDKFWARFTSINENINDKRINTSYDTLKSLSITQIGLPGDLESQKSLIYEKRIQLAVETFKLLEFSNSSVNKCDILKNTFRILSSSGGSEKSANVGADTLISLFVRVITLSGVQNLNSHLNYIKNYSFSLKSVETGYQGYIVSTFEATLNYLNNEKNLYELIKYSSANGKFWNLIESASSDYNTNNVDNDSSGDDGLIKEIEESLTPFASGFGIECDSFVRGRTSNGESCLMLAVLQSNSKVFKSIVDFDLIFTLDDILEDRNIDGTNLLSAALQLKNVPIIDELADIVLQADPEEIREYCYSEDIRNRNLGHFLFHRYELIPRFGPYVNWVAVDNNHQTPLFSIIRCYDHPNYQDLIQTTLKTVAEWYESKSRPFDYRDHLDGKGNTLMHSIRDGESLKLFLSEFENLNPNELNYNSLSPLMQFIRYNKLSNIKAILADKRLDLLKNDDRYYMNAMDYVKVDRFSFDNTVEHSTECPLLSDGSIDSHDLNKEIMDLVDSSFVEKYMPIVDGRSCGIVRAKFDMGHELCLYFKSYEKPNENGVVKWYTVTHSVSFFVKVIKLLKIENSNSFINYSDFWIPKYLEFGDKANIDYSNKLKINKQLLNFNLLITCLLYNKTFSENPVLWEFVTVQKPLNEIGYLQDINSHHETLGLSLTNIILKPERIGNYKTFLKYSSNELVEFKFALERFYKILIFCDNKNDDLCYSLSNILTFASGSTADESKFYNLNLLPISFLNQLEYTSNVFASAGRESTTERLVESVKYLRNTMQELILSIERFLVSKIVKWWGLYGKIKSIKDELVKIMKIEMQVSSGKKMGNQEPIKRINTTLLEIGQLFGSIDQTVINELNTNNTISQISATDFINGIESAVSSSYFIGIIEARRHVYTDKLIHTFDGLKTEVTSLNTEISIQYEGLCLEVSRFYSFKKDFLLKAMKQFVKDKLQDLHLEKIMLDKGLRCISSSK